MSTEKQIENISRQLMKIVGIIMYIFGSIGNILNICIFTKWSDFHNTQNRRRINIQTSNSSLYLLVSSIANLMVIIYPFLIRIMLDAYQYTVTSNNVFILCKFQYYILHTFDLISLTCICLATFDRYLISSRNVRLRQMNTTKQRTKLIILLIIILNASHSIPLTIYFDVTNSRACGIKSIVYSYYYLLTFHIVLHGVIPIIFLTIFGILTFKQLKLLERINHLNSDKQLSRMILLISIAIILSSIPNCIEQIHDVLLFYSNEPESSYLFLFHIIASLLFYTNAVYSFYIFYVSTPNFRKQVNKLILHNIHRRFIIHNQVNTISIVTNNSRLPVAIPEIATVAV